MAHDPRLQEIADLLEGVKWNGKGFMACCPAHADSTPSLSVNPGDKVPVVYHCHAGCSQESVLDAIAELQRSAPVTTADLAEKKRLPVAFLKSLGIEDRKDGAVLIPYRLADGTPAPRQRLRKALAAKAGCSWLPGKGLPVPYGLERLTGERRNYCLLVEGESDCWALWYAGFPAIGIPGANMTKVLNTEHVSKFTKLYIWREPDQGGDTFVNGVAERLRNIGFHGNVREIRGMTLGVKDAADLWGKNPNKKNFKATLAEAMKSAEPMTTDTAAVRSSTLPAISISQDLAPVTRAALRALVAVNTPPKFFRYVGLPCRLERDDRENPITVELTPDRMRHELARVARWTKATRFGAVKVYPPMGVVRDVLATPDLPLPLLSRIVTTPVFAPDGTLQTVPGYHEVGKVYYFQDGMKIPDVPSIPSGDDLNRARDIILELLVNFDFVSDADRAHAIALLLLPFVHNMIDGPTPNHIVEAPTPGSGKGLLTDVCLTPALGRNLATIPEAKSDEEIRKRITAFLLRGVPAIVLDNVTGTLNSGAWASALTAMVWRDRRLGKSEDVQIPVRNVWVTTGNNVTATTEIIRRSVRIRLDPKCDRPWQREGFRHPDLRGWAKENRPRLVWAALTMAQAWISAGRPAPPCKLLGSFEEWTCVVGGILHHAGISGFLANVDEFYEAADTEASAWIAFAEQWHAIHESRKVTASELLSIAREHFPFKEREESHVLELGHMLRQRIGSVIAGEYVISSPEGRMGGKRLWQVNRTPKVGSGGSGGISPPSLHVNNFLITQKSRREGRMGSHPNPPKTPPRLVVSRLKFSKLVKKVTP